MSCCCCSGMSSPESGSLVGRPLISAPVTAALTPHLVGGWPLPLTLNGPKLAGVAEGCKCLDIAKVGTGCRSEVSTPFSLHSRFSNLYSTGIKWVKKGKQSVSGQHSPTTWCYHHPYFANEDPGTQGSQATCLRSPRCWSRGANPRV